MFSSGIGRLAIITLFASALPALCCIASAEDDPPLTRNDSISDFQNRAEERTYNFDAPPEGLFRSIQFAEGFEEELGYQRTHEIVPVSITAVFRPDSPAVFIVFSVYQHLDSYQVSALCFPEHVPGLDSKGVIAQDVMYVALEDDTGYLRLDPPAGGWKPGRYKTEIHIGWTINEISLIGTMRFNVQGAEPASRVESR